MRCMFIGASMAMPTFELKYEDTWVYKVIKAFPEIEFIDKNRRASSVRRLISEGQNNSGSDVLECYNPDIVILHIGLTDAAPRLLKRESIYTKIINQLPFSKLIYDIVRKTKGRTINNADVNPKLFFSCLTKYTERAAKNNTQIICVKLLKCGPKVLERSPFMNQAIDIYNRLFDDLADQYKNVQLIQPLKDINDNSMKKYYQSDEIHLSSLGSQILGEQILSVFRKLIYDKNNNKENSNI